MNIIDSTRPSPAHKRFAAGYWVPTVLLVLVMGGGGVTDALGLEAGRAVMRELGFPDYFQAMLGVAKILGVFALLAPVPRTLREWAYAGFTFDVISALISLTIVTHKPGNLILPAIALLLVQLSYRAWRRGPTHRKGVTQRDVTAPA